MTTKMMKLVAGAAMVAAMAGGVFAAGNAANPDALALEPIPVPVEAKIDMDAPVAFDAATTVTLDCPDGAAAAWGTPSRPGGYGGFPQCDTIFDRALRMVGHDMKVRSYRDTGNVDSQIPPSWWLDN